MTKTTCEESPKHKWLIMVYMEAGDSSKLDSLAVQDLGELQDGIQGTVHPRVGGKKKVGGNPNVVGLVQMKRKWPDLPQRYFIGPGESVVHNGEAKHKGVATADSLKDFLSAGRAIGEAKEVTCFCLVLWGHNFGLGFGRDHDDPLTIKELAVALDGFAKERGNQRLDVLATNSCTMAYIEGAYQLKESVHYLVASQVFMPAKGFPYSSIVRSVDEKTTAERLGEIFVDEYVDSFSTSPDGEKVAMSLLDLDGAAPFKNRLEEAAGRVQSVMKQGKPNVVQKALREMQDVFLANLAGDTRPVLDLQNLAQNLVDYCNDFLPDPDSPEKAKYGNPVEPVNPAKQANPVEPDQQALTDLKETGEALFQETSTAEAQRATDAAQSAPEAQRAKDAAPSAPTPLVLRTCANPDLGPLSGVGVFAPFVVDTAMRTLLEMESDEARQEYESLAIFEGTGNSWPDLVYNTLRRDEPDEIVDASGVVQPAERKLVNQMVGAVDAAFNILDRVLKSSQPKLVEELSKKAEDISDADSAPFGPPKLKLVGDISLRAPGQNRRPARASKKIVREFERIEKAVHLVETTVKGVMTNSAFGLGPPVKSDTPMGAPVKSDTPMGAPVKSDTPMGAPVKSDTPMGAPVKSDTPMGSGDAGAEWGAMTAFLSSDTQVAILSVRVLFRALAASLSSLEAALSDIEFAAAECLLVRDFGKDLAAKDEYPNAMKERFERLFAIMAETASQARGTVRNVMAHPVYGLGRGPEDFGQSQRDQLAVSAGLSRRQLLLL